jgi:hypothetical protein
MRNANMYSPVVLLLTLCAAARADAERAVTYYDNCLVAEVSAVRYGKRNGPE